MTFSPSLRNTIPLLVAIALMLLGCGSSQTDGSEAEEGSGMARIDNAMVDSMRAAANSAAARDETSATQGDSLRQIIWLGALLTYRDGETVVRSVIKPVNGVDVTDGDIIETLNGTPVTTPQDVKTSFDAIAVGAPVRLTLRRAGTKQMVVFARPAPSEVPDLNMTVMQ